MSGDRIQNNEVKPENQKTTTINTIQQATFLERLPKHIRNSSFIIPYDLDNLYPNKIDSVAQRSHTTTTAIETHSDFLAGQGFGEELNKIVVNDDGQTLEEILKEAANLKSEFNGIALHFNYNRLGEIVEINEISFENLRWSKDLKLLYYSDKWDKSPRKKDCIAYRPFNPESAANEINEDGPENYTGQVLYWIPKKKQIYTVCRFDSVLNDAQFQDESSVYKLKSVQNNFNLDGIFKFPANMFSRDDEEIDEASEQLKFKYKGAKNASGSMWVPATNEDIYKGKLFEPIQQQNKDNFFKNQNEEAKSNIYENYQQPPILSGKSFGGMFNQEQFVDAFDYYNSKTSDERKQVEKVFNRFWEFTVWSNGEQLEIIPKEYITKRDTEDATTTEN